MMPLPRIASVDQRIHESEKFPRIRSAELAMKENEKRLKEKYGIITCKKNNFKKIPGYKKSIQNVESNDDDNQHFQPKSDLTDQAGFFTGHVLNRDRDIAKYLPYNEVFYPTLFEDVKLPPEFIENGLWMSGFLDRAARDSDLNEKLKKKRLKGKDKGNKTSDLMIRDNLSSRNSLKDVSQNSTTDYDINHLSSINDMSSIGNDETVFHINNDINNNNDENDVIVTSKKISQQKLISDMLKPYVKSLIKQKSKPNTENNMKKKISDRNNMISYELENIFEIQRIENKAAGIIQAVYRRMKKLYHWRYIVACVTKVPTIQRFVRGMITRKFVALWFKTRTRITTIWQAYARRIISNVNLKIQFALEYEMSSKIQRIVRGKIGRSRFLRLYRNFAAMRIQATWRGTYVCTNFQHSESFRRVHMIEIFLLF